MLRDLSVTTYDPNRLLRKYTCPVHAAFRFAESPPSGAGQSPCGASGAWGLDLSGQSGNPTPGGIHGAGGIGGVLAMRDNVANKSYLYCYDANGNVTQLMDVADGSVDARYEYYPYGGELLSTGVFNPFRFSTKYLDVESRAYYYGYRYHMPKHGRWLNRDPIGYTGGQYVIRTGRRNAPYHEVWNGAS